MPTKVVFSPEAKDDLREIWLYIALDNPEAADRVIAAVERASNQLALHPRMGILRPDYQGLYVWVLPEYRRSLMFYRLTEGEAQVEIVRVLQGSQNLAEIFSDGPEDMPARDQGS